MARFARRCWLLFLVCALVLLALAPGATLAAPLADLAPGSMNTWTTTGAMAAARYNHTATLLPTGKVLVAGGCAGAPDSLCEAAENSAELYDPQSGAWTSTGAMALPRFGHTATLLPTGKVLVTGGSCNSFPYCLTGSYHPIAGAELYDPVSGTWSFAARMHDARYLHTATLLPNGKVLVAGGYGASGSPLATAELYDPRTGSWTRTGSMSVARWQHTATLLPNGKVLVTGGNTSSSSSSFLASAELYDPRTGTWTATGSMTTPRAGHTATVLPNGEVLVAGGQSCSVACYLSTTSAELYNPSTGVWTPTGSMTTARAFHTATLLPNGMVLAAGGCSTTPTDVYCLASTSAEVYNPRLGLWSPTASLATARSNQTATLLPNGRVLVAGGINCFFNGADECPVLSSAELYTPGPGPLVHLSATSLDFGDQAVAASSAPQTVTVTNTGTLPRYVSGVTLGGADPQDYTAATTCTLALVWPGRSCVIAVRFAPTAVGSRTASLSIADNAVTSSRQVSLTGYATGANGWVATGSLTTARSGPTATLLSNGQVLIAGGISECAGFIPSCTLLSSAELYNPSTGTFTPTGSMTAQRAGQTATLLSNGKVLMAGGDCCGSAELYDPATGTFTVTGSMSTPRSAHTATLLPNGKVLVAGGEDSTFAAVASAEVYDPATGTWTPTGAMTTPRENHTATLLPNGMVLVTGGDNGWPNYTIDSSAELYNPNTGTWTATGTMTTPRDGDTATLLPDGQVLIAGGCTGIPQTFGCNIKQTSAELYDPATGTFTATGAMATARDWHTATLLPDGTVLVAGGDIGTASPSAEVYNPHTGVWSATGAMLVAAPDATATLLANGNVLVAGGSTQQFCGLGCFETGIAAAELYTPGPGSFAGLSASSLSFVNQPVGVASAPQTVTVTNSGTLPLVISHVAISGTNAATFAETDTCTATPVALGGNCALAVRFTPPTVGQDSASLVLTDNAPTSPQSVALSGLGVGPGGWAVSGNMNSPRNGHTATLLPDGRVLVTGGCPNYQCAETLALTSTELYDPGTGTWSVTGAMGAPRVYHTATLLPNGKVLVTGGFSCLTVSGCSVQASAELYDPSAGTWTATGSMTVPRAYHTATLLPNGKVLVTGGQSCIDVLSCPTLASAELYDPSTGIWTTTGSMTMARAYHTATLLPNGKVLVAGGQSCVNGPCQSLSSAELYDPSSGTWTATGTMHTAHYDHTATLLANGRVLVAGGCCGSGGSGLTSAELYDPGTGAWAVTGSLTTGRYNYTATLLPDGQVLAAGGCCALASAEVYNPNTGAWTTTGALSTARTQHTATLLPNGQILVAGGLGADALFPTATTELYIP